MIDMIRVGQTRNLLRAPSSLLEMWPRSAHHHPGRPSSTADRLSDGFDLVGMAQDVKMRAASGRFWQVEAFEEVELLRGGFAQPV